VTSVLLTRVPLVMASLALALTFTACSSGAAGGNPSNPAQTTAPAAVVENSPTTSDEAVVRRLLEQINEAWARGDAEAYASYHTLEADLIDFRGIHVTGRQAIVGLLQPLFDGPLKNTQVEARVVDFRFLSPTVAIMHTEGEVVPGGGKSVQTFVATKDAERWLIAAFQNTRIQATP